MGVSPGSGGRKMMLQSEKRVVGLIVLLAFGLVISVFSSQSAQAETLTYDNSITTGYCILGAYNDVIDFGVFGGGHVKRFVFRYVTALADPGMVEICFYKDISSSNCPAPLLKTFQLTDLEGSPNPGDGYLYEFEKDFDIPASEEFDIWDDTFGYSFEFRNNSSGLITARGGFGNQDYLWEYDYVLYDEWRLVNWDGSPYAGFYMQIYTGPVEVDLRDDPNLANVDGYTFNDVDGDGTWDAGELGLSGWEVYLDTNDNGLYETSEPNTVTDPNGFYEFLGLTPGVCTIGEIVPDGWVQTYPAGDGTHQFVVDANEVYSDNNFGNVVERSADIALPVGVGVEDVLLMASQWLRSTGSLSADIAPATLDGKVDYLDLAALSRQWWVGKP
jgi:hypothetical protein